MFAKMMYKNCPIIFPNRVTHLKLVEHDMFDFDIIFGMDWLHSCFAFVDCRTRVANINFPNEPV